MVLRDLTGQCSGRLSIQWPVGSEKHSSIRWLCLCECGNLAVVRGSYLVSQRTRSCGCLQREFTASLNFKHGLARQNKKLRHPLYTTWSNMIRRCTSQHHNYGGRGIQVCDRWLSDSGFQNFLADMGERPTPRHTLDRFPNNDGNYEPDNCRWATAKEQRANQREHIALLKVTRLEKAAGQTIDQLIALYEQKST